MKRKSQELVKAEKDYAQEETKSENSKTRDNTLKKREREKTNLRLILSSDGHAWILQVKSKSEQKAILTDRHRAKCPEEIFCIWVSCQEV